jgi:hypothetical protein
LLAERVQSVQAVQRLSRGEASQLNIGYVANVYHNLLPVTLGTFRRACPHTALKGNHGEQISLVTMKEAMTS